MKRFVLFLALVSLTACDKFMFSNPCKADKAQELVKQAIGIEAWAEDNPREAVGEAFKAVFSFLDPENTLMQSVAKKAEPYIQEVRLVDFGKPEKTEKDTYRCSAVGEVKGGKYVVVYTATLKHSGSKEDVYLFEVQEIRKVE